MWIDIDNSPHVPFFLPIVDELQKHGIELVLTARNIYQVRELLEFLPAALQSHWRTLRQKQDSQEFSERW